MSVLLLTLWAADSTSMAHRTSFGCGKAAYMPYLLTGFGFDELAITTVYYPKHSLSRSDTLHRQWDFTPCNEFWYKKLPTSWSALWHDLEATGTQETSIAGVRTQNF
jgi:hypothetical protein